MVNFKNLFSIILGCWRKEYKEGKIQAFSGNGLRSDKDAGTVKYISKTPSFLPGERFYISGVVHSTNVR